MQFLHRTWAEIDCNAVAHNFRVLQNSAPEAPLCAVVKADAYGHSAEIVAPILQECGAAAFAVSNIEEARSLRACGIVRPILILGYTPPAAVSQLAESDVAQAVYSPEYAAALSEAAVRAGKDIKVHIKLDTGMGRIGFDCRTADLTGLPDAIAAAKLPGFSVEGAFTHFAESDRTRAEEDGFTDAQYDRFCAATQALEAAGVPLQFKHCCNSAALLSDRDKHFDLCRPGIVLYGLQPAKGLETVPDLVPVMTLKSVVSMVKEIEAGQSVNYGRTFTATKKTRVATVSAGYADGYPRALSNCGSVLIGGRRAKIVGRICMDQFSVDVTDLPDVKMGDEVILFGKDLPVEELADLCGTIHYEIICGISPRVKRIPKKE